MEGKPETVKKRRIMKRDYESMVSYIKGELSKRKGLECRTDHETLWKEVDRQVRMKPMQVFNENDAEESWRSAMEMGDLSTASEVLSADVLRLIFPQDRSWLLSHVRIDWDRLDARDALQHGDVMEKAEKSKLQKKADAELRAFITQQHRDFGFRSRVKLSVKEALHHGAFVAEVGWEHMQLYGKGGAFKSKSSPMWIPHSMWNAYPDPNHLNAGIFYTGSMIIEEEKTIEDIINNTLYMNTSKLAQAKEKQETKVLVKYFGNITIKRTNGDIFLPNMKIVICDEEVLYAKPMDGIRIIYQGYDPVDVLDPYFLSPLVKQSPNHKISSIIANKFLDNVELKLDPPIGYDGNDPTLTQMGGPRMIPGFKFPAKGGALNFKQLDVGDPSWATSVIEFFKSQVQEGTGVSSPRAGAQRQADRVTATQIEEEAQGSELRTIDFVGQVEQGILSYLYIQHEMNCQGMDRYTVYNPEMGMDDFFVMQKKDLPDEVHFEVVGSKGVITERRRAQATNEVTAFLLSNEQTAHLPNVEEVAKQMYQDAGNKSPERLLNVNDENSRAAKMIEQVKQQAQEIVEKVQAESQKVAKDLTAKTMELKNSQDQLKIRNERALQTEGALRDEIRMLKDQMSNMTKFYDQMIQIKDEQDKVEDTKKEIESTLNQPRPEPESEKSETESNPVVVNIGSPGWKIERDENGDMSGIAPKEESAEG